MREQHQAAFTAAAAASRAKRTGSNSTQPPSRFPLPAWSTRASTDMAMKQVADV